MTELDAAYLAGFIDGEGCIGIHKVHHSKPVKWGRARDSHTVRVRITSTNKDIMDWIKSLVGGNYNTRKRKEHYSIVHEWYMSGSKSKDLLISILPYLKIKRLQAEIALQYIDTIQPNNNGQVPISDEVYKMREEMRNNVIQINCGCRNLP